MDEKWKSSMMINKTTPHVDQNHCLKNLETDGLKASNHYLIKVTQVFEPINKWENVINFGHQGS